MEIQRSSTLLSHYEERLAKEKAEEEENESVILRKIYRDKNGEVFTQNIYQ